MATEDESLCTILSLQSPKHIQMATVIYSLCTKHIHMATVKGYRGRISLCTENIHMATVLLNSIFAFTF